MALGDRLQISCYSWWLTPPRRLGTVEEDWHELVIDHGHLLMTMRGLVPSQVESRKVTLVDCSCHRVASLMGRFFQCPSEDVVRATPLSLRTIKCWSINTTRASMLAST